MKKPLRGGGDLAGGLKAAWLAAKETLAEGRSGGRGVKRLGMGAAYMPLVR